MDISKDIFRQIPSPALSLNDLLVTVNTGETDRRQKKGSKEGREGERKKGKKKGKRKGRGREEPILHIRLSKIFHFYQHFNLTTFLRKIGLLL